MDERNESADQQEQGMAFKRAMGLLAAVAVAAGIGLATVDAVDNDGVRRVLPTDASGQRVPGYVAPAASPADGGVRGELDPALSRPDRGNDHHG